MTTIDPSDLEENACQGPLGDSFYEDGDLYTNQPNYFTDLPQDLITGSESVTMASLDAFDANVPAVSKAESSAAADEEARLLCAPGSDVNSPRDIISPSGELSSPFSAMESDGEGIETGVDDASLSCTGERTAQRPSGFFGASTPLEYTTTPCPSSSACDDDYESTGSRKKRRKTRRPLHPYSTGSNLHFPKPMNQEAQHDPDTSPFSPPTCPKEMNFNFAESSRRDSGGVATAALAQEMDYPAENAKRTRTCENVRNDNDVIANVKTEAPFTVDTPVTVPKPVVRRGDEQILHRHFPRRIQNYELRILAQPESQHRARYLTEGSRGPVKDATQQGFPKVELIGYNSPAVLQVFVATDSGKIRPHGFYQACKVTGRNTSPCDEIEIEGTKVIEIPFKQEAGAMILSVDCVGILKLRNTDVEMRTGLRNQKRNQSVRLIFRVSLPVSVANGQDTVTVQIASTRISCTQPLGQPEICKKSLDKCSVEGGIEMFIIGRNFHRGTKVIYQDPEEPNGTQWSAEGEVDKDTFHQSHMVVRVPPYHNQNIAKPVNVQLLVEYQEKRCEPHSFTYTPRPREPEQPKQDVKQTLQASPATSNIETALNLFDGPIDKKFLVALFSKLLAGGMAQADSPTVIEPKEPVQTEVLLDQSAMVSPTGIPNQQALLSMLQAQSQLIPQAAGTSAAKAEVNVQDVSPTPAPPSMPNPFFANIKFSASSSRPMTQNVTNTNPILPASFTPVLSAPFAQIKFASLPTNDTSNLVAQKVKSEIPEALSNMVVTSTLQPIPITASSTNISAPVTFLPPSTSHTQPTFPPKISASVPIVISPASLQTSNSSFSKGVIILDSFPASRAVAATQVIPNLTFATSTSVANVPAQNPTVYVPTALQSSEMVFSVQNNKQQPPAFTGGSVSTPAPANTFQSQPQLSFQNHMKQPDYFLNTTQEVAVVGAQANTPLTQVQEIPPTIGLTSSAQLQVSPQNAPNPMQVSTNQAPAHPSMLQTEQFHSSFGSEEGNSVAQIMAVQESKDQDAHNIVNVNLQAQQIFPVLNQLQPMQVQAPVNSQGQNEFTLFAEQKSTTLQQAQSEFALFAEQKSTTQQQGQNEFALFAEPKSTTQQQGIQVGPVHQQTEAQVCISHQQNDQDMTMHVDNPFIESRNSGSIQTQANSGGALNNNYSTQSITKITTVSEVQSMQGVVLTQTGNLSVAHQMADAMVSPSEQQQMFRQMQQCSAAISMASNTIQASVPAPGFQNQVVSNSASMSMQSMAPGLALSTPDFQPLQRPNQMTGEKFATSQATSSPTNVSYQLNVVPASVPSQIFQTQQSEQQMALPRNTVPVQPPSYPSPESTTNSPPQMASQTATQQVFQSPPVQDQTFSPQNQALHVQNQPLLVQIQAVPTENQRLPMQNPAMQLQNPTLPAEAQGFPMQSPNPPAQSQKSPLENQPIQIQDQGLLMQNQNLQQLQGQASPVENQNLQSQNIAFSMQSQVTQMHNQPMPALNQGMPGTNKMTPIQSQSLPLQNQVFSMKEQPLITQSQPIPVQRQFLPLPNQQINSGNSAQVQTAGNFMYQGNNNSALQQQSATEGNTNSSTHHPQVQNRNVTVSQPMEPHSPNIYAMTKLLQTIDGSENLEAISREDVQRHCQ